MQAWREFGKKVLPSRYIDSYRRRRALRNFMRELSYELYDRQVKLLVEDIEGSVLARRPAITDRLPRLGRNGSMKVPMHLLSSIREARALGRPHDLLTLAVAAWCRHLRDGRVDDPEGGRLGDLARQGLGFLLDDEATFGSLGRCPSFEAAVARDLRDLAAGPVQAVVAARTAVDAELAS